MSFVQEGLKGFEPREVEIVSKREGLATGQYMTLQQVGEELGVTRERVRQIEAKFWHKLYYGVANANVRRAKTPSNKVFTTAEWFQFQKRINANVRQAKTSSSRHEAIALNLRRLFLEGLVVQVLNSQGDLVGPEDARESIWLAFTLKCLRIPCAELPQTGRLVIGLTKEEVEVISSLAKKSTGAVALHKLLEEEWHPGYKCSDLDIIASEYVDATAKKLTKLDKVYFALKSIGRPAHFSRVANIYNALYEDEYSSEHTVQSTLLRDTERVVHIGIRGTYALKEWGYEKPPMRLFDSVTDIVTKKFAETGKPIPFTVIEGEIGKYRQVVNPKSLLIAAHLNPKLQRIGSNSFRPKELGTADENNDLAPEELDKILRDFEKERA